MMPFRRADRFNGRLTAGWVAAGILLCLLLYNRLKPAEGAADNYDFFAELHWDDFSYDYGYDINGTDFQAKTDRPWVGLIDEEGITAASARIQFEEPLCRDTVIQIYFSTEELTEELSRTRTAKKGTREIVINFPRDKYRELRFDIRGSFQLSSIQLSNQVVPPAEDKRTYGNGILLFLLLLDLGGLFWKYGLPKWKEKISPPDQVTCFALICILWGIAFAFLIIPWQMPDEYDHLQMIGKGFRNHELAHALYDEMPLDSERIMFHPEEKIDASQVKELMKKIPSYNTGKLLPRGIDGELLRHFPAAAGVMLGALLRLPAYWTLLLGKFCSLLFYVGVCSLALKITPRGKWLFEAVMLLPMCMQQAVSLSYDAVLLPVCFLFIGYILYLKFEASVIYGRNLLAIAGMAGFIAAIKIPYILLAGIVFLLPLGKIEIHIGRYELTGDRLRRYRGIIMACFLVTAALGLWGWRENQWLKIVYASVCQWAQTIYLFGATWKKFAGDLLVSLVGNFGYKDTPTALWFVGGETAFIVITGITCIKKGIGQKTELKATEAYQWRGYDRAVIYLTCAACIYVITLSMVRHTACVLFYGTEDIAVSLNWQEVLYQIPFVGGLQGRYYIPVLLLGLLPVAPILEIQEKTYRAFSFVFFALAFIYTCFVVYCRFWY